MNRRSRVPNLWEKATNEDLQQEKPGGRRESDLIRQKRGKLSHENRKRRKNSRGQRFL
jgi:hypothetical protein